MTVRFEVATEAQVPRLHAALADGSLKPDVEHVLPLEKAAEAQDIVLAPGRAGAVLLSTGQD